MENFKQYLSEGADDRERDAAKEVIDGLTGLRLEKKVAEVASARQAWLRRRFWNRVMLAAALVFIAGVAFIVFNQMGAPALPLEPKMEQPQLPENKPNITPETPEKTLDEKVQDTPIANNKTTEKLSAPRFPAPNIRGENSPEDKAWKALLDKVWYTEYPPAGITLSATFEKADQLLKARDFSSAYVQLQRLERKLPENDTLRFLKGYTLMEMGEGAEALRYFEAIPASQSSWNPTLQWNKGLSLLLTGDQEKALKIFREIASTPGHPYQAYSKKAIPLLK